MQAALSHIPNSRICFRKSFHFVGPRIWRSSRCLFYMQTHRDLLSGIHGAKGNAYEFLQVLLTDLCRCIQIRKLYWNILSRRPMEGPLEEDPGHSCGHCRPWPLFLSRKEQTLQQSVRYPSCFSNVGEESMPLSCLHLATNTLISCAAALHGKPPPCSDRGLHFPHSLTIWNCYISNPKPF